MRKLLLVAALLGALSLSACSTAEGERSQSGAPYPARSSEVTPEPMVETVEVPDLAGSVSFDALGELGDLGFDAKFTKDGEDVEPNWLLDVASQSPTGGELAPVGSTVEMALIDTPRLAHTVEIDGEAIDVWVETSITELQARAIAHDIGEMAERDPWDEMALPDGAYFIDFNCKMGSTDTYDHRQANGKLSVGDRGEMILGLNSGVYTVEMVDGATCP